MFESNRVHYLFIKYTPLVIGLIILSMLIDLDYSGEQLIPKLIIIFVFSGTLITTFLFLKGNYKIVCISRNRILVEENKEDVEYNWLDVEFIHLDRFLRIYSLKLKEQKVFYFTPYGWTSWLDGDTSEMGQIINKMKAELDI